MLQIKIYGDKQFDEKKFAKVENSNTIISDALTFDQIVDTIAKDNNILNEQAANQVIASFLEKNRWNSNEECFSKAKVAAEAASYCTIADTFTVTDRYLPEIKFYCQTEQVQDKTVHGITKIVHVSMDRVCNLSGYEITKQFHGNVYVNLEDVNRIYYQVNGDFFNDGITTIADSVPNPGGGTNLNFTVSDPFSHFAYCDAIQRCTF